MSDRTKGLLELASARTGHAPATICVLAHSYRLLHPFLDWAGALAMRGRLPAREQEVCALRISHLCGSAYEWDEHVNFAAEAGLTSDEIDIVGTYPDRRPASAADAALLDATDQLHHNAAVDDATYARLAEHFTPEQLVEIPMVVGQYTMLSMLTGFIGIGPDKGKRPGDDAT